MNSTHSETGKESYNSARLRVDGGYVDLFLSRYATSGRRLPEKEQMLWTPPQARVHHTGILPRFPSLFPTKHFTQNSGSQNHTFNFPDSSLTEFPS